ncbi:MAG: 3'-5' exonuclease [Bacteroidetes bacterium]|nr:3'-5' exonuclease [Bacteroidota bacterium]
MNFVAIDFETANPSPTSICAVGIAVVVNGQVVNRFARLVRPTPHYYLFTHIHGITAEMTAHAPDFASLWPEVRPLLASQPLVAHNKHFDRGVLARTLECYGLPPLESPWHCTVAISRKVFPQFPNHRLSTVCQHLNIPLNHHEAESDAAGAAHIALEALAQLKVDSLEALEKAIARLPGPHKPHYYSRRWHA